MRFVRAPPRHNRDRTAKLAALAVRRTTIQCTRSGKRRVNGRMFRTMSEKTAHGCRVGPRQGTSRAALSRAAERGKSKTKKRSGAASALRLTSDSAHQRDAREQRGYITYGHPKIRRHRRLFSANAGQRPLARSTTSVPLQDVRQDLGRRGAWYTQRQITPRNRGICEGGVWNAQTITPRNGTSSERRHDRHHVIEIGSGEHSGGVCLQGG